MAEHANDQSSGRWSVRPDGSNWGDFGADDQLGRLNLITPERRLAAMREVREGIAFCLSLPLDCPRVPINRTRKAPRLGHTLRGEDAAMNFPYGMLHEGVKDVVCDDVATLHLQYSTQWDALCHMGFLYEGADGEPEATYYNGYRAHEHVRGPVDYLRGRKPITGPYGAQALGIETMAETCVQGRGVMIDLFAHCGTDGLAVGYDRLMRILEVDGVEVESGDIVCLRSGFDRALLRQYADPSATLDPRGFAVLDGFDEMLLQWIEDSGLAAIVSDTEAVERFPDFSNRRTSYGSAVPLHNKCLFRLGIPLGELFLLSDLADWLRKNGRSRFLFTGPPLRLPGAAGSPVTAVATV